MADHEKLPATFSVHLTADDKRKFAMVCSFNGHSPSEALRAYVIDEIQKWEERFQSMQQVFGNNSSTGSTGSSKDIGGDDKDSLK